VTTAARIRSSSRWIAMCGFAAAAMAAGPRPAAAQLLVVTPQSINFPSSDPDTVPVISSSTVRVTFGALGPPARPWTVTVRADGPLVSGVTTIPISTVSWIATPSPPFVSGTLSTVAQTIASGTGTALLERGDVTFRFANSWNYNVGTYTQTITFTLTSP
jgi:hypothetical protein